MIRGAEIGQIWGLVGSMTLSLETQLLSLRPAVCAISFLLRLACFAVTRQDRISVQQWRESLLLPWNASPSIVSGTALGLLA